MMKQAITGTQWDKLSPELKDKHIRWIDLQRWQNPKAVIHANMSIANMIDFLYQYDTVLIESEERSSPNMGWTVNHKHVAVELCDALWDAVKEVLPKL